MSCIFESKFICKIATESHGIPSFEKQTEEHFLNMTPTQYSPSIRRFFFVREKKMMRCREGRGGGGGGGYDSRLTQYLGVVPMEVL